MIIINNTDWLQQRRLVQSPCRIRRRESNAERHRSCRSTFFSPLLVDHKDSFGGVSFNVLLLFPSKNGVVLEKHPRKRRRDTVNDVTRNKFKSLPAWG